MYQTIEATIEGRTPTLMHNGQLANPINKWAKAIKEVSGKRNKSDADHAEMARLEWFGSLYVDADKRPCWPSENVESMLVAAAKKRKEGPLAKTGLLLEGDFRVIHDGPADLEKLWADERFRNVSSVVISGRRIMRTRPVFPQWKLELEIGFDPEIVNKSTVLEWLEIAGRQIGLSDWRPRYGRFDVVS